MKFKLVWCFILILCFKQHTMLSSENISWSQRQHRRNNDTVSCLAIKRDITSFSESQIASVERLKDTLFKTKSKRQGDQFTTDLMYQNSELQKLLDSVCSSFEKAVLFEAAGYLQIFDENNCQSYIVAFTDPINIHDNHHVCVTCFKTKK